MTVFFPPAARAYMEEHGGAWEPNLVRPLTDDEIIEASGKITSVSSSFLGAEGVTSKELDSALAIQGHTVRAKRK